MRCGAPLPFKGASCDLEVEHVSRHRHEDAEGYWLEWSIRPAPVGRADEVEMKWSPQGFPPWRVKDPKSDLGKAMLALQARANSPRNPL